ncbi:MAG: 2-C-methyl-D-erythritol 4-phosphate cytidylyltransferase [Chloroflexi bacterium]|jgi:2-C-methyl-D-erythritol 4-phosphate cytidylyltransferase|nr:MAG: 2-C-methyl-D-erythritol 4-phosphate cytidylyltransferase [Chloroflexota bacterium]
MPENNVPSPQHHSQQRESAAVIVAAGQSSRMEGLDKVFMQLHGSTALSFVLDKFEAAPSIRSVVLVVRKDRKKLAREIVNSHGFRKVSKICIGGERRQDSVRNGLATLGSHKWVVIHDAARPCLTKDLIENGIDEAINWGSAVPAIPLTDTIKIASNNNQVEKTLDRTKLRAAQTPQIFQLEDLQSAFAKINQTVTDEAELMELAGFNVHLYEGLYSNIKITTAKDVAFVHNILSNGLESHL